MEVLTHSPRETQKLGEKISNQLTINHQPLIIALTGDLGSGKTTFIQGLARGLGIKKRVISPTFVFIRQYPVAGHRSPVTFYHVDLYRINEVTEAKGLGLEEIFADPGAIVVIEWADRIKEILPKRRIDIYFEYLDENKRRVKLLPCINT